MATEKKAKPKRKKSDYLSAVQKRGAKVEPMRIEINAEDVVTSVSDGALANPKHEQFCRNYVGPEFFANGARSYAQAFDLDMTSKNWIYTASSNAGRLLKNPTILNRINELLELGGFNQEFVNKQLLFLITQNEDLRIKHSAIETYFKYMNRILPDDIPKENVESAYMKLMREMLTQKDE